MRLEQALSLDLSEGLNLKTFDDSCWMHSSGGNLAKLPAIVHLNFHETKFYHSATDVSKNIWFICHQLALFNNIKEISY